MIIEDKNWERNKWIYDASFDTSVLENDTDKIPPTYDNEESQDFFRENLLEVREKEIYAFIMNAYILKKEQLSIFCDYYGELITGDEDLEINLDHYYKVLDCKGTENIRSLLLDFSKTKKIVEELQGVLK